MAMAMAMAVIDLFIFVKKKIANYLKILYIIWRKKINSDTTTI